MTSLADLDGLDREGLAALWRDLFGEPVLVKMSQPMLRRFLAFELQVRHHGRMPSARLARLMHLAEGNDRKTSPTLWPGARLLREWNGTTHVVDVLPDGFLWNGVRYRSLSAIARAITNARWSGPRFFGLVGAPEAAEASDAPRKGRKVKQPRAKVVRAGSPAIPVTKFSGATPTPEVSAGAMK